MLCDSFTVFGFAKFLPMSSLMISQCEFRSKLHLHVHSPSVKSDHGSKVKSYHRGKFSNLSNWKEAA